MCLPSCTERLQFMCIKMGKLTVYANTKGYNVPALHKRFQPFLLFDFIICIERFQSKQIKEGE